MIFLHKIKVLLETICLSQLQISLRNCAIFTFLIIISRYNIYCLSFSFPILQSFQKYGDERNNAIFTGREGSKLNPREQRNKIRELEGIRKTQDATFRSEMKDAHRKANDDTRRRRGR